MAITRLIALASALLLAVGVYAIFYCIEKMRIAADSGTTVGDDVIVIVYVTTVATTLFSSAAVFLTWNQPAACRALPISALMAGLGVLGLWSWLHLSGVVVSYSSIIKQ